MGLCCLIALAFVGVPASAVPRLVPARDPAATGTTATQDVPVAGAVPETGGQDLLFPAAGLLLVASVLAYAVLRRRGRP